MYSIKCFFWVPIMGTCSFFCALWLQRLKLTFLHTFLAKKKIDLFWIVLYCVFGCPYWVLIVLFCALYYKDLIFVYLSWISWSFLAAKIDVNVDFTHKLCAALMLQPFRLLHIKELLPNWFCFHQFFTLCFFLILLFYLCQTGIPAAPLN